MRSTQHLLYTESRVWWRIFQNFLALSFYAQMCVWVHKFHCISLATFNKFLNHTTANARQLNHRVERKCWRERWMRSCVLNACVNMHEVWLRKMVTAVVDYSLDVYFLFSFARKETKYPKTRSHVHTLHTCLKSIRRCFIKFRWRSLIIKCKARMWFQQGNEKRLRAFKRH